MPFDQQLDLDGGAHDLARETRQDRLFAPAPTQLDGQTWLEELAAPVEVLTCAYDGERYPRGAKCGRCGADNPSIADGTDFSSSA